MVVVIFGGGMPLPGPEVKGFGYLTQKIAHEYLDEKLERQDSRLSSTSLLHELIEPSASEVVATMEEERPELSPVRQKDAVRLSISFLRRETEWAKEAGLNLDYDEVRKRDDRRIFEKQVVPILPQKSSWSIEKRHRMDSYSDEDMVMPLLKTLGMTSGVQKPSWARAVNSGGHEIPGLVGEIASSSSARGSSFRRRSHDDPVPVDKATSRETIRYSSLQNVVRRRSRIRDHDVDPEKFFNSKTLSYDEYYADKDDLNRYTVISSSLRTDDDVSQSSMSSRKSTKKQ